ncbi:glycosyl transferase family 2 [Acidimicrobium ferrooxidans DSM 10331]|uniref:Glycosyl transferase family 2 n=1 Tax=Acidimicrobium ferrooxidans (strain DSM 10331 / JCM 15462 / NBRC 103882 / ICP) TaxID=525909 RepID=C7LZ04_ACIFD|nr:glycosyltransferase family 2 protein [Acidimicrobium ferrooxidans]ACU53962.1 glycosyl transferase family 2 [Acidimicrobium ferrooxidans DSM 10331]
MRVTPDVRSAAFDPDDAIDRLVLARFDDDNPRLPEAAVMVVIPAFDEEATIADVIRRVPRQLAGSPPLVVVVSDGSRDATVDVARREGALVLDVPINRGQGAALRLGYLLAIRRGARIVGIVDADGQWDPADLATGVDLVDHHVATFAQGSRRLGTSTVGDPIRDLGVRVFSLVVSALIGQRVGDTSSGIRVIAAELLGRLRLDQPQYQSAELLLAAAFAGATIVEFPVTMVARRAGTSKKGRNWRYGLRYGRVVARTYLRERWIAPR